MLQEPEDTAAGAQRKEILMKLALSKAMSEHRIASQGGLEGHGRPRNRRVEGECEVDSEMCPKGRAFKRG